MNEQQIFDAVVVGGGFYGCEIATFLKEHYNMNVILLERKDDVLQCASFNNQARVHNGYHYPRNIPTALRSRVNFKKFCFDYAPCIDKTCTSTYAIARQNSKVTAEQFRIFMEQIGAEIEEAPREIQELFNLDLIEKAFTTMEYSFNSDLLKKIVLEKLRNAKVPIYLNTSAEQVEQQESGLLRLTYIQDGEKKVLLTKHLFNTTYSQLNYLLSNSNLEKIYLKHELTEIALIDIPKDLEDLAITVMCGPFFSFMPFPAKGKHCLSHVRYTPHHHWYDAEEHPYMNAQAYLESHSFKSKYIHMVQDAARYLPMLARCTYAGESLFEVKTVLPINEEDDGRPILFKPHYGLQNLHCIMGGKIDNIYDVLEEITTLLST